ncbi:MAG TPA: trypsin-like serine protease [Labilithrix sp.]|nr:trypsin-like serine protease [Labilithrix sp.]
MMKRILLALPLVLSCSSRTPGVTESTTGSAEQAIQGGQVDTGSSFAIALLGGGLCSGTLIAPNLVLTARHCVETAPDESGTNCENGPLAQAQELAVSTEAKLDLSGGPPANLLAVSRILPMPEVTKGCSPDIALVELAQPIPASVAKPARPAVEPAFVNRAHFSDHVTAVGFGVDDTGNAGERRIKKNLAVLCVPGDKQYPCDGVEGGADYEIVVAPGACQGDSGGGLYDQTSFDAKDPVVVATVSRGPVDAQHICGPGVFVRVDHFKEFIIAKAIEAATNGGYTKPSWAVVDATGDAGADAATKDASPEPASVEPPTPPTATPAAATTTTTSGCALQGARHGAASPLALGALGVLGVLVLRRRRRGSPDR